MAPIGHPEQVAILGFIKTDWLRLAAWAARKAELNDDAKKRGAVLSSAARDLRVTRAEEVSEQAKKARDRLRTTLLYLAGGISTWVQRVESAYATPETQTPVTDALIALCKVGSAMLADASEGMKKRCARSGLDAASIQKHEELAATAAAAMRESVAIAPASPVTQADVDLWDGIAISFFEQYVEALEQAHEEDPTIPAPSIIGLRGWFRRLSRKDRGEPGGGETEARGGEGEGTAPPKEGEHGGWDTARSGATKASCARHHGATRRHNPFRACHPPSLRRHNGRSRAPQPLTAASPRLSEMRTGPRRPGTGLLRPETGPPRRAAFRGRSSRTRR